MKSSYIKLIGPAVSLMLIAGNVLAQNTGGNTQGQQISALQATVSNLQQTVTAQGTKISQLQGQVAALTTSNNDLHQSTTLCLCGRARYVYHWGESAH